MVFKSQADMPAQCPPADAKENDVEPVYRFIDNDNALEIDFLNHKERNKPYPPHKTCEALAISFFTTLEATKNAGKRIKSLRNKKFVAGKITSKCGTHHTVNNHLNLWLYKDADMLKVFLRGEDSGGNN
ncbi:hypothetical protein CSV79_09340 [Sporosarcina sp. P13]|uniref:hypothetical protein n=1 Tax=Sporosarcina sp. P13 TaxID=2048263 RepID=UPI000C1679E1|nr:hypothetical protein [Sporosarcina sp. P13]PIC63870.1 hypothetical protein CSV79_09340 [Sporosarcina sp. P13]